MIVTSAGGLAGAVFLFDHDRRVRNLDAVAAREGRAKKRLRMALPNAVRAFNVIHDTKRGIVTGIMWIASI